MRHVFLNPDGTQEAAVYTLVLHPTGICYSAQCAGYNTEIREDEGFLIPLGEKTVAEPLMKWFRETFHGLGSSPVPRWDAQNTAELRELVADIACWRSNKYEEDQRLFLRLDESYLEDGTEAWVPVETPYGKGILLFPNSD